MIAKSKKEKGIEYFHYTEAYYLTCLDKNKFVKAIAQGKIVINLRMHLKENGKLRDHGTVFRGKFSDFNICYNKQERLV